MSELVAYMVKYAETELTMLHKKQGQFKSLLKTMDAVISFRKSMLWMQSMSLYNWRGNAS